MFTGHPYTHGQPTGTAVVLLNLGTPEAPTPKALRAYLRQFLSDRRVVEIPPALWLPLLVGVILPIRSKKSAAKYASIWTPEGSPLAMWTAKQAKLLRGYLGNRGHRGVEVAHAMTYGRPSVSEVLDELCTRHVGRVLLLPLYPQYSGTTTAAAFDAVYAWARRTRRLPELRFVNRYHDHPSYIAALADRVHAEWIKLRPPGPGDRVVFSFHGVPRRTLLEGDPYHCECHKTARLLAERLGLHDESYVVTFQSRFGKAEWLKPYTEPTVRALAQQGVERVDVFCPGFTSDHLETLEEIAMEVRDAFFESAEAAGHARASRSFNYLPALNDSDAWIRALADIAEQHLQGWPTRAADDPAARAASAERARALGAER
jgi:ferrochelatase